MYLGKRTRKVVFKISLKKVDYFSSILMLEVHITFFNLVKKKVMMSATFFDCLVLIHE
jgi:hypothetical protein